MSLADRYFLILDSRFPKSQRIGLNDVRAHAELMARLRELSPLQQGVSDAIFETYVLPMWVNDEPVVLCSALLAKELLPVISGKSAMDAAIAVNYWCMANVNYRFNDEPTADVLTIMRRGHGRCGEESTFAVMAYRSVGIPARQVYAPLWSHCDDNHGWAEVFVNGAWHYLGACEAEPALDMGWFDGAASRAALVRTYADADADSLPDIEGDTPYASVNGRTAINVTPRYADCAKLNIHVLRHGTAAAGAQISICVANYGAFSPVAALKCDESGNVGVTLGICTVYIFAYCGDKGESNRDDFCFAEVSINGDTDFEFELTDTLADGRYNYCQHCPSGRVERGYHYLKLDLDNAFNARRAYTRSHGANRTDWQYPSPDEIFGACTLHIVGDGLRYGESIAVEHIESGSFRRLDLRERSLSSLCLPAGRYRINAYTRQIDGTLDIVSELITLSEGCERTVAIRPPEIRFGGMLRQYALPSGYDDIDCGLICFIKAFDEPSQHILNELKQQSDILKQCGCKVKIIENPDVDTLSPIRKGLDVSDKRLPLCIAVRNSAALFGLSGYRVGAVELLIRLLNTKIGMYNTLERSALLCQIDEVNNRGRFKPDWASLSQYECPKWFEDAKLGLFIHWGLYSVPAFGNEWYSRNMYKQGSRAYDHHILTYGRHKDFGYKDFIPLFTADSFNADELASLAVACGCRYIVPVAEHHDGFQLYKSRLSVWNSFDMTPNRDILGELFAAANKHGLVACASTHRLEHWFFMGHGREFESDMSGVTSKDDMYYPSVCVDPSFSDPEGPDSPSAEFLDDWLLRTCELIDSYKPRLLYFDWWTLHNSVKPWLKRAAAYYYNRADEWGREVVINYKYDAFAPGCAVPDMERGQFDSIMPFAWQSCTSVSKNSWGYIEGDSYKSAHEIICALADIVSKNGCMLLNIGPKGDGSVSCEVKTLLTEIGGWMLANGEAIYSSRPWRVFGEGEHMRTGGQFSDGEALEYTSSDIRYTTANGCVYAIILGAAPDGVYRLREFATPESIDKGNCFKGSIANVAALDGTALEYERSGDALTVFTSPAPRELPLVLRIEPV